MKRAGVLAWVLFAVTIAFQLGTLALALLLRGSDPPFGFTEWNRILFEVAGILGAPVLGLVIASRRPDNAYGWLWGGVGLSLALLSFGEAYAALDVTHPGTLPIPLGIVILGGLGWVSWVVLTPFLLLLFPTGRLPSRRWRWVSRTALTAATILLLVSPFQPGDLGIAPIENPYRVQGTAGTVVQVIVGAAVFVLFGTMLAGAASLVVRFRSSVGESRLQIKWLAYGVLTAFLAGGYLLAILALQSVLPLSDNSPLIVAASTLGVVAVFGPLRSRVQVSVDRRFNRSHYDAERTVATFGSHLRRQTDLEALSAELLGVTRETMQPTHASLWLATEAPKTGSGELR